MIILLSVCHFVLCDIQLVQLCRMTYNCVLWAMETVIYLWCFCSAQPVALSITSSILCSFSFLFFNNLGL